MTTHMLWCLEGITWETLDDPMKLAEGLTLHLVHADLLMVLMQVGERQQAYLALTGCRGCTLGRCEAACPRDLLRRMLSKRFAGCDLRSVPRGLSTRPYSRFVVATPAQNAHPLDGQLLSAWTEARLVVHWRTAGRSIRAGAVLAVGADGPEPAEILALRGWQASRLHAHAAHDRPGPDSICRARQRHVEPPCSPAAPRRAARAASTRGTRAGCPHAGLVAADTGLAPALAIAPCCARHTIACRTADARSG